MTEQLSEFHDIIKKLAPKVQQADFGSLLRKHTKNVDDETRFLLKMEMKRLAKPCLRGIDLRIMVDDECQLVNHQGIEHYLNDYASQQFDELIAEYGEYTFGVYESILATASASQKKDKVFEEEYRKGLDEQSAWKKYITPYNELMYFHHRRDERMNFVVDLEIIISESKRIEASSVDISHRGLKLKLQNTEDISLMKNYRPLTVVFSGFSHSSGLSKQAIEYKVVRITGEGEQTRIHLSRDWQLGPQEFNEYIANLIKHQKRRYRLNLDNTHQAIECKIFEQAFASNTPSLSLYINSKDKLHPYAEFACVNTYNSEILDYWLDENKEQKIGNLVNEKRLLELTTSNASDPSLIIYAFTFVFEDKVYFYSASQSELADNDELRDVFLSYASRKVSWRVFKLTPSEINPNYAYMPTSIPNGINKAIDKLNRPLAPRLISKLQHLTHVVTVSDITFNIGQQCYQRRELTKDKIKLLAAFGHPRNKPPKAVQVFRYTTQDKRRERRYQLRTQAIVHDDVSIEGVTEDVSVSGLRLELISPSLSRVNDKVSIELPSLQARTEEFDLTNLRYRIKHISEDGYVLHLEAISDDELSTAEQFFSRLIQNNKDKLGIISNEESVPGMGTALRNIQSKVSPQLCAYIQRTPIGYMPIKVTTCQPNHYAYNFMRHEIPLGKLNLSWLFHDRKSNSAFIAQSLKTLKLNKSPIETEVFIAFNNLAPDADKACVVYWEHELASHKAKYRFIKNTLSNKQFIAFRVTINAITRPDTTMLQQEIQYLGQYAIHKARELEELMWNISGEIYLTDITDEVLIRYKMNSLLSQ